MEETRKLNWDEIKRLYDREWVELTHYDWPESELNPSSGIVRVHSPDRAEFHRRLTNQPPVDSAILFVGKQSFPSKTIFSAGLRRIVSDHA